MGDSNTGRRPSQNLDDNTGAAGGIGTRSSTSAKCGTCDKAVKKTNSVLCEYCAKVYHASCQGVPPDVLSAISVCESFHWFCKTCNPKALDVLRVVQTLKDKNDELEARLVNVESKLTTFGDDFKDFKEKQEAINVGIAEAVDKKLSESTSQSVSEMNERELRKPNLIFFNLPESDKAEPKDRISEDREQVKGVLDFMEVGGCEFQQPVRLGTKGETPRPLKVRFKQQEDCVRILKSAKKLQGSDTYISRDMTPLEREERRALVKLKNRRQEESSEKGENAKWAIRRGKVINVARQGAAQAPGDGTGAQG